MKGIWTKAIATAALTTVFVAASGPAHAAISYSLTDLGGIYQSLFGSSYATGPGGIPENKALGISDTGFVTGILKGKFNGASQTHIISWNGTTARDLGMQPLSPTYPSTLAWGYGINNSGQIVGYTSYNSAYYAFLYNPVTNSSTYLGKPSNSLQTTATAVNDSGQVVGYTGEGSVGPYAYKSAFIYNDPSTIKRIPGATTGSSTGSSSATAISNTGLVTGYSTITGNIARAFIYNSSNDSFQSLGTLGGNTSNGTGINDNGDVVGYSLLSSGVQHAFLYTNAKGMIDLGALGSAMNASQANAVNNNGVVVGTSNGHAFIYQNNQMIDLNTLIDPASGFTLTNATDINNKGQIVGYGTFNGQERAFELTLTPTPIPPAVFLFGSGLAGLGYFRRRARKVQ